MTRNQLWNEIRKALKYNKAIAHYTDKRRRIKRSGDIIVIAIPFLAVITDMVVSYFDISEKGAIAFIGSLLTGVVALLKQLIPLFNQPEKELFELDSIGIFYGEVYKKLREIWNKNESKTISEDEISKKLSAITKDSVIKETDLNRLMRKAPKDKVIEAEVEYLLKNDFYNE